MLRAFVIGAAIAGALLVAASGPIGSVARVGAGYKAKTLCSEIFVAGRNEADVLASDFGSINPALKYVRHSVDEEDAVVSASLIGLGASRAIYRGDIGCTLLANNDPVSRGVRLQSIEARPLPEGVQATSRPIDMDAINAALTDAFADEDAAYRAVVVLVDGAVVAERYAPGFDASTPVLSWSMAKSVTSTLVGAAIDRGYIDADAPALAPEWAQADDDARAQITWNDLLRMQSGLSFEEDYADPRSDVLRMLYRARDMGGLAAANELAHEPGSYWAYSSGTSNIVARALDAVLQTRGTSIQEFSRNAIFSRIGASSFVLETDTAGNFVGSSFVYATPRDWARLGQLYLDGGSYRGDRVLSADWVDFVQAPASNSGGQYGGHFWLNNAFKTNDNDYGVPAGESIFPGLPESAYSMAGHDGQYVVISPDKRLVIMRAGATRKLQPFRAVRPLFAAIYAAVGQSPTG
ncbi:MAG: serine hydrolase [Pseudomonadota bacterium]